MAATVAQLCEVLQRHDLSVELQGQPDLAIHGVATLEEAGPGEVSFLSNPRYEKLLNTTRASAVLLRPGVSAPQHLTLLRVSDPYLAVTLLMVELHGYRRHRRPAFAQPAQIAPSARIGRDATIYPGATIDEEVVIGDRAVIYPGVYIGPRCRLGDDVLLYPNVVIYDDTVIGSRVTIHSGTVIGNDGLGYANVQGRWLKIPQIGTVEIEDDVEIGSNCSIDRATLGRTRIGRGTKLSNLIAIGHGTRLGEHCLLVAQVGLAGSVHVGNHVTMAGQVGVVGHIRIGDRATIGAQAGVTANVPEGQTVLGAPAIPIREMRRQVACVMRLPELNDLVRGLEKRCSALEARLNGESRTRPAPPSS